MGYIRVRNLGKAYKRYRSKHGRLLEWLGLGVHHDLRWVLRHVSFDVEPGESVGIIGLNGAGKSTLLKIIAGVVKPTTGFVDLGGRVSALLELGTGFHPDFTGRENVYTSGQLRGLSKKELDAKIEEIEHFADIGDYFDQPVRVYSSGMQVRLAFSVATAMRPHILIVDEALSVGDAAFQHKSFNRIRQFRDAGTTLLFVSHDPGAVKTLCNRALLIDNGLIIKDDTPEATLDYYNAIIVKHEEHQKIMQTETQRGRKSTRSGNTHVSISSVEMLQDGLPTRAVQSGEAVTIRIQCVSRVLVDDLTVGILIRDRLGNDIFGTNTWHHGIEMKGLEPGRMVCVDFYFPRLQLGTGSYSLTVALHKKDSHVAGNYDWWDRALVFQVVPDNGPYSIGSCNLQVVPNWCILN
ncbi:ABC transporter ATP-binding protein [Desulfosoma caldarium]|uniref:Lipopolysaccharide transport system ATP-binding protein n=1 Tax=Desulfosoma caldarium TaxID=610254 RepID=A0A3N1VK05_9BACT|nr:ABC transporter ATP-binding protein [Desulfosoma caldarium]ROR03144.1 lipopolysaccharide transport system ATP-binding protein [Desulfosoma caldarium]